MTQLIHILLIRYLWLFDYLFDLWFKNRINNEYWNIEKYLLKNKREFVRSYQYIRYRIKKCHPFLKQYKISDTLNLEGFSFYSKQDTYPNFQEDLKKFKELLINLVDQKESKTIYKFGDGDYYFLKQIPRGSAKPGRRALSKPFDQIDIKEFYEGVKKNDYVLVDIKPYVRRMYKELFNDRKIDFPGDFGHGLVANKWFFSKFKGKIGLIGAKEKLELIEKLLKYKEYQEYLGIEKFNDYIYVPQKFACDDITATEKTIGSQLKKSNSDIFLFGMGHVKSALLHRLKIYKRAIYVDVGGAIDAIAGVININRNYMGYWTNYQLKDFDYSKIDFFNYKGWGKHIFLD